MSESSTEGELVDATGGIQEGSSMSERLVTGGGSADGAAGGVQPIGPQPQDKPGDDSGDFMQGYDGSDPDFVAMPTDNPLYNSAVSAMKQGGGRQGGLDAADDLDDFL